MLHKSKSHKLNLLKYMLVLPLLVLFVFAFNTETVASPLPITEQYTYNNDQYSKNDGVYIITKETTDDEIEALISTIKEDGGTLDIKKIKRNQKGHITSIKINLKTSDSEVEGSYSDDEGIPPVHFGNQDGGGIFISSGDHNSHAEHIFEYKSDSDVEHDSDGDYEIIVKKSRDKQKHKNVWVMSGNKDAKRIEIKEVDGKKIIEVDGKEVTEEELEEMEKEDGLHGKHFKFKNSEDRGKGNVMIFRSDDDEDKDIEVISKEGNGFFFIDTDGDSNSIYIIDGKEVSKDEVKAISPERIATINVYKGKKAIEKYGNKAKDGVIEITTKSKDK